MSVARIIPPTWEEIRAFEQSLKAEDALRLASASAGGRLMDFVEGAWHVVEPSTRFLANWHIDVICDRLERLARGEFEILVVNIPPGCMKSTLTSVMFPAWCWLRYPWLRFQCLSHDDGLVERDADNARKIVKSTWYGKTRAAIAANGDVDLWDLDREKNAVKMYRNTARGFRQSKAIRSGITGHRAHVQLIDDPHDVKEVTRTTPARSAEILNETVTTYRTALFNRVNAVDRKPGRLFIGQRIGEGDLYEYALTEMGDDVEHVVLPMRFDPEHPYRCPDDPRVAKGELLWPEMYNEDRVAAEEKQLGDHKSAQHDQLPVSLTGEIFKRSTFRHYEADPQRMRCDEQAITVDCAFDDQESSSDVAVQVWGRVGGLYRLLDRVARKMDIMETIREILRMAHKWPMAMLKLVEKKANGFAVLQLMQHQIPGLVPFPRIGNDKQAMRERQMASSSKVVRAKVFSYEIEAGNVEFPLASWCPWIVEYEDRLAAFPAGRMKDDVDASSQIIIRWTGEEREDPMDRVRRQMGAFA